jgi:energy-coupling factor transporter ATP-binding protein EcfA2
MKIAQLLIQSTPQFQDFQIDLTYPEGHPKAAKALDKVCFIGPNGTGKSGILRLLAEYLKSTLRFKSKTLFLVKLQIDQREIYAVHINNNAVLMKAEIDQEPMWLFELIKDQTFTMAFNRNYEQYCIGHEEDPQLYDSLWFDNNGNDLVVYQPADQAHDRTVGMTDMPISKPFDAESLVDNFPYFGELAPDKASEFWAMLIFHIVKREQAFQDFAAQIDNRGKAESALRVQFATVNPEVLPQLAAQWQPLLDPLGLRLDVENATLPTSIRDRLTVYIVRKLGGEKIEYGELGTGTRKLLFDLGYLWALQFGRQIDHSFCLLEEPETGLHPRHLHRLLGHYEALIHGGQLFVSTHSPIIAAAFDPAERLILERDAKGSVTLRRSDCSPDAAIQEILEKDFSY